MKNTTHVNKFFRPFAILKKKILNKLTNDAQKYYLKKSLNDDA